MCGRFTPIPRPQVLEGFRQVFGVEVTAATGPEPQPDASLFGPGQCLPFRDIDVVYAGGGGRILIGPMQWQLVHGWSESFRSDYTNFNTRFEKLGKPHNRELLCHTRCVVPVSGFFENRMRDGQKVKPKESFRFTLKDQEIIPLGGIYSVWTDPEDSSDRRLSCSVITMEPNELVAGIHDRMPFIVPRDMVVSWLDDTLTDFNDLVDMIQPLDPALMRREREQ